MITAAVRFDNIGAADHLVARFASLVAPDFSPLMFTWERIIQDDNRRGVLAGLDKDGRQMTPVAYRPVNKAKRTTAAQRNNAKRRGTFAGFGLYSAGINNNLSSSEYRKLGGPPLAPRGPFSRVITNLKTDHRGQPGDTRWFAFGYWDQVVSLSGRMFLQYHFRGAGRLPIRDLRGVRPQGVEKAKRAARAFLIDLVRSHG